MPSKGRRDVLAKKAMAEGSSSPMGIKITTAVYPLFPTQYFPVSIFVEVLSTGPSTSSSNKPKTSISARDAPKLKRKRADTAGKGHIEKKEKAISDSPQPETRTALTPHLADIALSEDNMALENYYEEGVLLPAQKNSRRDTAALAWNSLIPSLVYPLMAQLAKDRPAAPTYHGSEIQDGGSPENFCLLGCQVSSAIVQVISFGGIWITPQASQVSSLFLLFLLAINSLRIYHCKCKPPAVSLIEQGCFSSTPTKPPAWAFDLSLLEHASLQFLYSTPSVSAWCDAACHFLRGLRIPQVPSPVCEPWLYLFPFYKAPFPLRML